MKILVVDDSPTMRRIIIDSLLHIGYDDVVEAEDGKDALQRITTSAVDFVITDWNMPVMNGLELLKKIRANKAYHQLPVIMVTTKGNKEDVIEAMKAKINNYVVKPFTPEILKSKIEAVLNAMHNKA